jgi:type IX secretion system PorP/SprF family membrane protein
MFTAIHFYGQQNPLITQYMFNNMAFNPGFAGNSGGINVNGLFREQYIGFKDPDGFATNPETILLNVDSPIKFLHGGVGGSIFQDKIGYFRNIGVKLGYAFKMDVGQGQFNIGVALNLQNITVDFSKLKPIDESDPLIGQLSEKTSDMIIDMGAGLYYTVPEKFYAGLSADNLLQSKGSKTFYQLRRHYYLTGGYFWTIPNSPRWELQPSVLFMFDGSVFQLNATALLEYNKKFYGGLAYRYQDAVSILAGMYIKNLHIGLAYDISTSKLTSYNSGSIEVMVGYCFKIEMEKFRKSYRNTRFL